MGGFSRFGRTIGTIAGNASKKSGELVEAAKLNSEISRLQLDIDDLQFELGRTYYEDNKNNPVGLYAEYIAQIRQCEQEIRLCNERLLAQKGMLYCPHCDAVMDGKDEFCSKCGARLPLIDAPGEQACRNCGAVVQEKEEYCQSCGFLQKK